MKKIIIILVCILLCSCSNNTEKTSTKDYVYSSDPILESAMLENKFVIIDVRTKEEYNTGHIKDAINIPYDEIAEKINISKKNVVLWWSGLFWIQTDSGISRLENFLVLKTT